MALLESDILTIGTNGNIRAIEAGNAAEFESRMAAEIALAAATGASEAHIIELQIAGAASGFLWQGWFVTAADVPISGASISTAAFPTSAAVVAAEGGNPAEAILNLKGRLAPLAPLALFKLVVAGAGDGPRYLAAAMVSFGA